jgi:hypothetical protein
MATPKSFHQNYFVSLLLISLIFTVTSCAPGQEEVTAPPSATIAALDTLCAQSDS